MQMRDVTERWLQLVRPLHEALAFVIRGSGVHTVGMAGPPGAGKTTIARKVAEGLDGSLVLSLDDFYLSRDERRERGLQWRGPPGSHDLAELLSVLDRLRRGDVPVTIPRFSAKVDDRVDPDVVTEAPLFVLVEGWVLGYRSDGYGEILERLDLLVFLGLPEVTARRRRFAREAALRGQGGGFSEPEMLRFWDEVLAPGLTRWVRDAKESADLVFEMDEQDGLRSVRTSSEAVLDALGAE